MKKFVVGLGIGLSLASAYFLLKKRSLAPEPISAGILKTANNEWRSSSGTIDLINIEGKGYVPMIWMAITGGSNQLNSILKVYVDGETIPSISADLGSLSSGHLYDGQFSSEKIGTMVNGTTNMAFYFGFPIPYSKSIRITLTLAQSCVFWSMVYYNDGGEMKGRLYSSCQPLATAQEINQDERQTMLDIQGKGKIVYVQQTFVPSSPTVSYMEGNHRFYIDNEEIPSYESTGSEDLYLSGFMFSKGFFVGPHVGCTVRTSAGITVFRDFYSSNTCPVFNKSIKLTWQNGESEHSMSPPTKQGYVVLYYLY